MIRTTHPRSVKPDARTAADHNRTRSAALPVKDNRATSVAQRQLAEAIERSPQTAAQRVVSDQLVGAPSILAQRKRLGEMGVYPAQRATMPKEEELLQGKMLPVQRQAPMDEEQLQGKFKPIQRLGKEDEELQKKPKSGASFTAQMEGDPVSGPNRTGLPDQLKTGIESLSGMSMDHVRVHYNSAEPAQLNALAYAQGSDIHVAPGQEHHLPHEAWHVVQQAQGRVKPTMQMKEGVPVNDDVQLEREADLMGHKAKTI
ncbi:MAG: DUF4157 domain-containing protein [Burkholderiales bacterium]